MGWGGRRPGAGRKRIPTGGRAWARSIADDPEVRAMLHAKAKEDPDVALKLFEHGYGRPPQALDVNSTINTGDVVFICEYSDGSVAAASAQAVPTGTPE